MSAARFVLTLSCPNRPGIIAAVSTALFEGGFNIFDAQQFDDIETGHFFMRVAFNVAAEGASAEATRARFAGIAAEFGMNWTLRAARGEEARCDPGLPLRSLSGRSALSLAQRRITDGAGRDHRQLSARNL